MNRGVVIDSADNRLHAVAARSRSGDVRRGRRGRRRRHDAIGRPRTLRRSRDDLPGPDGHSYSSRKLHPKPQGHPAGAVGFARTGADHSAPTPERDMDQLDLARIQFATTSIYHFFFVPVTMGLAILVAVLHTRWHRSGDPEFRRLTRFFGTLMLISISVGVVTGLVQEFQFGMDWSALLAVRRRRVRRAAGHGGPGRVLPGVDVPGAVAVRLERAAASGCICSPPG